VTTAQHMIVFLIGLAAILCLVGYLNVRFNKVESYWPKGFWTTRLFGLLGMVLVGLLWVILALIWPFPKA
jgi:hypothetical protein